MKLPNWFGPKRLGRSTKLKTRLRNLAAKGGFKIFPRKPQTPKPKPSLVPIAGKPSTPRRTLWQPATSSRDVNRELLRRGCFERLQTNGLPGHWQFTGGLSGSWASTEVPGIHYLFDHTVLEWIAIHRTLASVLRDPLTPATPPVAQKQKKFLARRYLTRPAPGIRKINYELRRLGFLERLRGIRQTSRRRGRWWFEGGSTARWVSVKAPDHITHVGHLTVQEWVDLHHRLASEVIPIAPPAPLPFDATPPPPKDPNLCTAGLHEWTPTNTLMTKYPDGVWRICRACRRASQYRYAARQKALRKPP